MTSSFPKESNIWWRRSNKATVLNILILTNKFSISEITAMIKNAYKHSETIDILVQESKKRSKSRLMLIILKISVNCSWF